MSVDTLREIIISCMNDVYFDYHGKKCGITVQVKDYIPTFQSWCGESVKEYNDVDDLLNDNFFDGNKLADILSRIELFVA